MQTPYDAPAVPSHIEARKQMLRGRDAEFAALRRLDTHKRLCEFAVFIAIGGTGMALNYAGPALTSGWLALVLRIVGTLATALMFNAFVLLMHEGMHGILVGRTSVNRWVSVALGATFFMSFTSYRVLHQHHHRYLGDRLDPDDYANYVNNRVAVWLMQYMRLLFGTYVYLVAIPLSALRRSSRADRIYIVQEYALLAALYTAVVLWMPHDAFLALWLYPLLITGYMTAVRGLSQHGVTDAQDPFLASRTILPGRLVALIMLNENYHLEHHLFPEIPSYHLPQVYRLIDPRLPRRVTDSSYLGFLLRFFKASLTLDESPIGLQTRPAVTA